MNNRIGNLINIKIWEEIGKFKEDKAFLENGKEFTLVNDDILGDDTKVSITYKELYKDDYFVIYERVSV